MKPISVLPVATLILLCSPAYGQSKPAAVSPRAFACDRLALDPDARHRHFDMLSPALRGAHIRHRELPDGYEFEFPPGPATVQIVSEWAQGESLCCPFFDIVLRFDHDRGGFWLRLTGGDRVKQFIRSDFASWFRH